MADITPDLVKQLREKTSASMMECKKALVEAQGNLETAETLLRKKGITTSYIHLAGRVGVLIEVNCETDFVAKNESFGTFVKDLTLHIAASSPKVVRREDVSEATIANERDIATELLNQEIAKGGKPKPAEMIAKIVDGRVDKYYATCCLLEQAYIKNPDQSVGDFIKTKISELGENIQVRRFVRYAVGEDA